MFKKVGAAMFLPCFLSACMAPKFAVVGKDEYSFSNMSSACAAGNPSSVLDGLRQEALKFCAGRKEGFVETSSEKIVGIPVVRCASASLTFKCQPQLSHLRGQVN